MIRVFVVDDEKLVRRGIIGLIDWENTGWKWLAIPETPRRRWNF